FVVADGRTEKSYGLSLYQVADFMKRYGCKKVYNLDGGGSSTMVFQGRVINFPTSYGSYYEREVTDIVYLR
ncbi:MAG: phosphodiester glycosidase family protein, partial [Lachnospiraceae bacterium]|nr:phosphodiester glycosidase family protein [Lachnospiraceae bacterium]